MAPAVTSLPEVVPRSDNNNSPAPEQKEDILNLMSLKDLSDSKKDILLQNVGYMFGIRAESIDGPRRAMRQVAKRKPGSIPCVRDVVTTATEVISTSNKRDANYVHEGWSTLAISGIPHWAFLRATSGHDGVMNQEGKLATKRFMGQRLAFDLLVEDLEPVPEFEANIKAALTKSTKFDKIQALYRVFNAWGDVIPLEFDVGFSFAVTDLVANFLRSVDDDTHSLRQLLKVNNATRAVKQHGGDEYLSSSDVGFWIAKKVPAAQWSQIRIRRVIPTINLLNDELRAEIGALRSGILSLSPASMTRTVQGHESVDDDPKAVRPITLATIRSNVMVDSITFTYEDGAQSKKHGAPGGIEHEFPLDSGEHITEIIIWSGSEHEIEWIYGIQFFTNEGRVSKHYGGSQGKPTVLRSGNGILVGLNTMTREHPIGKNHSFSKFQAIWRHDIISSVPKQGDVFSDYIGGDDGIPFNDRTIIGNSKSMRISKIEASWGPENLLDYVRLTYVDDAGSQPAKHETMHHGGVAWVNGHTSSFELEMGEHIVTVSGRHNGENIVQLCLATNLGRTSDVFGGGEGRSFSERAPRGANGGGMRLQYICGKSRGYVNGLMFVWTPI